MKIRYHKNFKKALGKQSKKIQRRFIERLRIFVEDQFHYSLNNHALTGKYKGWRSINVTGDVRVHYEEAGDEIILIDIDTHSNLY